MLLIVQNGFLNVSIGRYLDEKFEIVKSFLIDVDSLNLAKYSIIIILGGHQSVKNINTYHELDGVVNLIKKCIAINKPILGICLGCQLIAHVLGCEIKSGNELNIGYDTYLFNFGPIFTYHYDYVIANESIEVLQTINNMTYAFRHRNLLGVQCHPDISPDNVIKHNLDAASTAIAIEKREVIDRNNRKLLLYLINMLRTSSNGNVGL